MFGCSDADITEPGILVMTNSLHKYANVTEFMLGFLLEQAKDAKCRERITAAMETVVKRGVVRCVV